MDFFVETTNDGSKTVRSSKFGALYHSKYGALEEGRHIFINCGLDYVVKSGKSDISILELGFGTGLNAFLSLLSLQKYPDLHLKYSGVEGYPISIKIAESLGYPEILSSPKYRKHFLQMHQQKTEQYIELVPRFLFQLQKIRFENFIPSLKYDLIYYDPFSYDIQSFVWEFKMLEKMANSLTRKGILVSYCAKGSFKRALKSCGFAVESPPGPAGKREITRAQIC